MSLNPEQLDDLSTDELVLLKASIDSLIAHMESLKRHHSSERQDTES